MDFACDRAQRYHAVLAARCDFSVMLCQFVELASSSSVLLGLASGVPGLQRTVMGVAAVVAGLALATRAHRRMAWHKAKQERFSMLARRLPADAAKGSEELLAEVRAEREDIEKDDGPAFECLSVACHNAVCLSRGWTHGLYPLTWWQRHVLTWFPARYDGPAAPSATE